MRLPRRMALRSPRPPRWRLRPRLRVVALQRLLIISQRPLSRLSPWARQPLRLPVRSVCLRVVRRGNLGSRQGGRGGLEDDQQLTAILRGPEAMEDDQPLSALLR